MVRMTRQKISEVINLYRTKLIKMGVKSKEINHKKFVRHKRKEILSHCLWMLPKMAQFVKEGEMGKVNRWLGFIQGDLWYAGIYTLEDLRNHNRSSKKKVKIGK